MVNALLTQLDRLKHKKNVLVMSTSNLAKAIGLFSFGLSILSHNQREIYLADSAFVDRADVIQYVDLPSREAIYEILRTSLCEMVQKGMVEDTVSLFQRSPVIVTLTAGFYAFKEVPTLEKAIFNEERSRSINVETLLGDSNVSNERKKSELTGCKLFALAAKCRVCVSVNCTDKCRN